MFSPYKKLTQTPSRILAPKTKTKVKTRKKSRETVKAVYPSSQQGTTRPSPPTMTDCKVQPETATSRGPQCSAAEEDVYTQPRKPPLTKAAFNKNEDEQRLRINTFQTPQWLPKDFLIDGRRS